MFGTFASRPLLWAGFAIMLVGPTVCWTLFSSRVILRWGLPSEIHSWSVMVGALSVALGWVLVGAYSRPFGSAAGGVLIGAALYLLAGWGWFTGFALLRLGYRPEEVLLRWPDLVSLQAFALWPIFAASGMGLLAID